MKTPIFENNTICKYAVTQIYLYTFSKSTWPSVHAWILLNWHYFNTCVQTLRELASLPFFMVAVKTDYILLMAECSLKWMLASVASGLEITTWEVFPKQVWYNCEWCWEEKKLQEQLFQMGLPKLPGLSTLLPFFHGKRTPWKRICNKCTWNTSNLHYERRIWTYTHNFGQCSIKWKCYTYQVL